MKLLILALCVLAVNAATTYNKQQYQPSFYQGVDSVKPFRAQAAAKAVYQPLQPAFVPVVPVVKAVAVPVQTVKNVDSVPVVKSNIVGNVRDFEAPILRSESDVNVDGFNYVYETGNGISAQATGSLKKVDDLDVITVRGGYQYLAPDGTPVQVSYIADENGYQPQSDLLPVAPPVPVAIARALEYIAAHPPAVEPVRKLTKRYIAVSEQ